MSFDFGSTVTNEFSTFSDNEKLKQLKTMMIINVKKKGIN